MKNFFLDKKIIKTIYREKKKTRAKGGGIYETAENSNFADSLTVVMKMSIFAQKIVSGENAILSSTLIQAFLNAL